MNDYVSIIIQNADQRSLDSHDLITVWVIGLAAWLEVRGSDEMPVPFGFKYCPGSDKIVVDNHEGRALIEAQMNSDQQRYSIDDPNLVWRMGLAAWDAAQSCYSRN